MDQRPMTDEISADFTHQAQEPVLNNTNPHWITNLSTQPEEHSNGCHKIETFHCHNDSEGVLTEDDHLALSNDGLSDFSNSDISLPEVCITSNTKHCEEEMNYEVQQAYRIFSEFLTEKHKVITSPFLHPIGNQEAQYDIGGVRSRSQANVRQSICLRRMEEKFIDKEYETITEFVADFRLMLENCYRYHGVDHWLSKQAQKLEIMLEQKLTLLSRKLREKTTLAVTSKGRFAVREEWISTSSTRRRQTSRSLKTLTVGGHESIMVQTLRVEEQQKAKEEKRLRELEKKEAEEMSAKEMDEWEKNLLSQASPHNVETLWELPAIGHFLCLAQNALNLPEIVFFELERCLLMPRCSILLSKIMSSLLCPPQRRSTLHRRPVMPYRRWESELRQRVKVWYQSVGASHDQAAQAEQLGLCHQFFSVLGEISPLEAKAFHMLPFYHRVWLLKGLCDHVYETQSDIQDAVLSQPIHECRESILGYDSKENAYIHFPHFCGADLRIYCQSPCTPPTIPFTTALVKRVEVLHKLQEDIVGETSEDSGASFDDKCLKAERCIKSKIENTGGEQRIDRYHSCKPRKQFSLKSNDEAHKDESSVEPNTNSAQSSTPFRKRILISTVEEKTQFELNSKRLKEEKETNCSLCLKNETVIQEHCLSIGEHCYTGRSPAGSVTVSALQKITTQEDQKPACCKNKISSVKMEQYQPCCGSFGVSTQLPSEPTQEMGNDKILTTNKTQRKKTGKKLLSWMKHEHSRIRRRRSQPEGSRPSIPNRSIAIKRKEEKKKYIPGNALNHLKKKKVKSEPSFKLVCTNLDELRELINKTEDELDDLESTKKRLNRRYNRREAVKDLHSTLIRLLNELTPWEPKLSKAYQRNRLRLKKEFEVFKNHPEYSNFVREECISPSSDDGDLGLLLEQFRQSEHEDPEHILPRGLGGPVNELSSELTSESPVTHISFNHQKRSLSTAGDNLDSDARKNTFKFEPSHQSVKPRHSDFLLTPSLELHSVPLSKPNSLHMSSGKIKNYTPIPTLLAKSVGNKVTLMKQPAYPLEIDSLNLESKRTVVSTDNTQKTVVSTGSTSQLKISGCSSDPTQNFQQKHEQNSEQSLKRPVMDSVALSLPVLSTFKTAESLKESTQFFYPGHTAQNPLVNSSNTDQRCEEIKPQQVVILPSNIILHKTGEAIFLQQSKDVLKCNSKMDTTLCMSTNSSGFPISENKILVQQVPPSKNIGLKETSSSFSDVPSVPKSQQSGINVARSKGTQHCRAQTSTSQCTPNYTAVNSPASDLMSTDSKQELKTVCIRESQSILVTTRGGNTGIVKVQKSSDHPACLSKGPAITISPQLQAYLIPKTSFSSSDGDCQSDITLAVTTASVQIQRNIPPLKSNAKVATSVKTSNISFSQEVCQFLSPTTCQALTGKSGCTSATNLSKLVAPESSPAALVKKQKSSFSNFVASPSLTAVDVISEPCSNKTNEDKGSQCDKLFLISPYSHDATVCCTNTLPTSVILTSLPTATASLTIQGSNATLKQASITEHMQEVMKTPATQKMVGHTSSSVNPVSLFKDKTVFVPSGISTDTSIQIPCLIATTTAQNTAVQSQFSKCLDAEQVMSITAQPAFINSNVISRVTPASSLNSLKHLDISSMVKISQPGNTTRPSTNPLSTTSFKKNLGLSTIMMSSNSNCYPATSQSISKPVSTPSSQSKSLNSLFISNASCGFDKTSSLSFTKPQVSCAVPKPSQISENNKDLLTPTTTTYTSTALKSTAQEQIVINTSMPLPGGAHIALNNAHFMVPPQGLGPGSHVFVISGNASQQLPAKSAKEATAPFQEVNQSLVLFHSTTRLPCVPAVKSFVACTSAVAPSLQATSSIVTAARLTGPYKTSLINKTKTGAESQSLQTADTERTVEGKPITSTLPVIGRILPQASTPLTSAVVTSFRSECSTTTTTSLAFSLSSVSPPLSVLHKPSTVLVPPFKADSVQLTVTTPSCSQGLLSPTHSTQASAQVLAQHPTINIGSISQSSSTALMHMGHSSLVVQKQEPTVVQAVSDSGQTMKDDELALSLKNGDHETAAQSFSYRKNTTHCPVILSPPAMEKHLLQTSFLRTHTPAASKILIGPNGAVLSTVQCKVMSTKEQLDL